MPKTLAASEPSRVTINPAHVEGSKESIQGALSVFDKFAEWPGLRISIAKSRLYLAGVAEKEEEEFYQISHLKR